MRRPWFNPDAGCGPEIGVRGKTFMVDPGLSPRPLKVLKRVSIHAGEGRVTALEPGTYQTRVFALDVPMQVALWVLDASGRAQGWMSKAEADAAERDGTIAWV